MINKGSNKYSHIGKKNILGVGVKRDTKLKTFAHTDFRKFAWCGEYVEEKAV